MKTAFWLDVLKIELDAIGDNDLIEPSAEVEPNEQVVGLVPKELRKLYTRIEQTEAEVLRFMADARVAKSEKERTQAIEKTIELKSKAKALWEILWVCIREEYKLWGPYAIGIRKSWNIVKKEGGPPSLPDFIKKLLGLE